MHRCHYFSPETDPKLYACSCGECDARPSDRLLQALDQMRHSAGRPFIITSGPRCPDYNREVGGVEGSEHTTGEGADIACGDSRMRYIITEAAILHGITRIGWGKTFVHIGVSKDHDQCVGWLYG